MTLVNHIFVGQLPTDKKSCFKDKRDCKSSYIIVQMTRHEGGVGMMLVLIQFLMLFCKLAVTETTMLPIDPYC